jgi:DNA ligase-1
LQTISKILEELNVENGSNYKLSVLKKYTDHELLKRVLQMTMDHVKYTYGLSAKRWAKGELAQEIWDASDGQYSLEQALDFMEQKLSTRELTGNAAIAAMHDMFCGLSEDDTDVIYKVLNRDLRINVGRTQVNKVFPNLIQKPVYMRCGLYDKKSAKKIDPKGMFVQLKADGTYREFTIENGVVSSHSRSGEEYEYPVIYKTMLENNFPDGHYFGELTVVENGKVLDRATGNGLINSDNPPHDNIVYDMWDYVTLEEYSAAAQKIKGKTPYHERFAKVQELTSNMNETNVRAIESHVVNSFAEALKKCSEWMNMGLEGAIVKDRNAIFRDGTSDQQLKLKLAIVLSMRITGFQEGTVGTVREKTFGAMLFASDDGMIKGKTSGFTDKQLEDFNSRREEMIGQIIDVECNDLTMARGNDYYALSHPRFVEVRLDKTETDTLERALQEKQTAMELS